MSGNGNNGRMNVFTVKTFERHDQRSGKAWTKIGVAFPHREGPGLNIELDALPKDGKLVVLPPRSDSDERESGTDG
jgi:hypothetical protein